MRTTITDRDDFLRELRLRGSDRKDEYLAASKELIRLHTRLEELKTELYRLRSFSTPEGKNGIEPYMLLIFEQRKVLKEFWKAFYKEQGLRQLIQIFEWTFEMDLNAPDSVNKSVLAGDAAKIVRNVASQFNEDLLFLVRKFSDVTLNPSSAWD